MTHLWSNQQLPRSNERPVFFGFIHEQVLATDSCGRNGQSPFTVLQRMGTSLASLSLRAESLINTVLAICFTSSVLLVSFFFLRKKMRQLRSCHRYQTAQVVTFLNRTARKFLPAASAEGGEKRRELTDPGPLLDFFHVDEEVPLFKRFILNPFGPGIHSG